MKIKLIKGLSEIQSEYDAFFIDLWGVVHNGIELNSGAIEVLENLDKLNKRFVLLSNAPRPSKSVQKFLLNLKMKEKFIKHVFTSGEAALQNLKKNVYGEKFFHLGPKKDNDLIEGIEKNKTSLDKSDFILCTGLLENETSSLDYYKSLLINYNSLKMICTNPDLIVHRGNKSEYCAGSVAATFEKLGGKVIYFGKPYPEIYNLCIKNNKNILAIGDNIRTDIRGANRMNLDSLFIINGIHKEEFTNNSSQNYDKILDKYNVQIKYYQKSLSW